jgi:hypothetical protein
MVLVLEIILNEPTWLKELLINGGGLCCKGLGRISRRVRSGNIRMGLPRAINAEKGSSLFPVGDTFNEPEGFTER